MKHECKITVLDTKLFKDLQERPVIFKIERIDIPENEEEKGWLEKQDSSNGVAKAYTG